MKKGKGRPPKEYTPQEVTLNWKTFDVNPPHGEIVYVKGKKTSKDECIRRMGSVYIDRQENKVDATQFTHWRLVY